MQNQSQFVSSKPTRAETSHPSRSNAWFKTSPPSIPRAKPLLGTEFAPVFPPRIILTVPTPEKPRKRSPAPLPHLLGPFYVPRPPTPTRRDSSNVAATSSPFTGAVRLGIPSPETWSTTKNVQRVPDWTLYADLDKPPVWSIPQDEWERAKSMPLGITRAGLAQDTGPRVISALPLQERNVSRPFGPQPPSSPTQPMVKALPHVPESWEMFAQLQRSRLACGDMHGVTFALVARAVSYPSEAHRVAALATKLSGIPLCGVREWYALLGMHVLKKFMMDFRNLSKTSSVTEVEAGMSLTAFIGALYHYVILDGKEVYYVLKELLFPPNTGNITPQTVRLRGVHVLISHSIPRIAESVDYHEVRYLLGKAGFYSLSSALMWADGEDRALIEAVVTTLRNLRKSRAE